jgi:hypothetical protein
MKLAADKKEDLKKLADCFEKIEELASKMGVEVEDLMQEFKNNNTASYDTFKKSLLAVAEKRMHAFRSQDQNAAGTHSGEMSILKEEKEKH